jgi:hypothetical protein
VFELAGRGWRGRGVVAVSPLPEGGWRLRDFALQATLNRFKSDLLQGRTMQRGARRTKGRFDRRRIYHVTRVKNN